MQINPINSQNGIKFKAEIRPTPVLKDGIELIESCINSGIMKDMNYAKDFLDSLVRIRDSKKVQDFKIEIDKRRAEHTYTKINGKRVSGGHNESMSNVQDNYLAVEGTKCFASKLEDLQPSYLDYLKSKIEEVDLVLDGLKERYANQLQIELAQAKKMIFNDVK